MNRPKRLLYSAFISSIKVYQRFLLDIRVWGRERIPPGPKIYMQNQITATDPYWIFPRFKVVIEDRVYRCVTVLRGPFCVNIGEPPLPELYRSVDEAHDNQRIMDELKGRI